MNEWRFEIGVDCQEHNGGDESNQRYVHELQAVIQERHGTTMSAAVGHAPSGLKEASSW